MNDELIGSLLESSPQEETLLSQLFEHTQQELSPKPWQAGESVYVPVDAGAIRVIKIEGGSNGRPVVFVPGWGTVPEGFSATFEVLFGRTDLYYVETREKRSSRIERSRAKLDMDGLASDVAAAIRHIGADDFVLIGTCWGSSVILHGLSRGLIEAPTVVVSDPMHQLWAPKWVRKLLIPMAPLRLVDLLRKPLTAIVLRRMPDGPQRRRTIRFIDNAVLWKWKRAAVAARDFELFGLLPGIEQEVFVTNGANDIIHESHNYPRIAAALPRGRFLYLRTDESRRERLLGVLGLLFSRVSSTEGLPEELNPFERHVAGLR